MTEHTLLDELLLRLDNRDEAFLVVTCEDIGRWPHGSAELLLGEGLMVAAEPAAVYTCYECFDSHSEEVIWIEEPPGSEPRLYVPCPLAGRVRVDPDDLLQWQLSLEGWARLIGRLLGLMGPCQEAVLGRVWWLGLAELGGGIRECLLVRGLEWSGDGNTVRDFVAGKGQVAPPAIVTPVAPRGGSPFCSVPLSRVLELSDGGFHVDRVFLDLLARSWPAVPPEADGTGERAVLTHSDDYRTVALSGVNYTLTTRQAQVVELLHESYCNGIPEMSQERILDRIGSESDSLTLRDVFRKSSAWKALVVQGTRRGMYRLNL